MSLTNTDIYDITSSINELAQRFTGEDSDILALDIYGFITSLESKKIQTAAIMCSELANEVFPSRAKIDKNIITHAIMQNITNINATPAKLVFVMGIKEKDLDSYMTETGGNTFRIDSANNPITIEDEDGVNSYKFYIDYDILLERNAVDSETTAYSAVYMMDRNNPISNIDNPYLKQPMVLRTGADNYVTFQCTAHQLNIEMKYKQVVSSNFVDNKTLSFTFNDQLADFIVVVNQGGVDYYLTPIFEGAAIDPNIEYYCTYIYVNPTTIRIKFDRQSFIPKLNADIRIEVKTCVGSDGNIEFNGNSSSVLSSTDYGYQNIITLIIPNGKATGGVDRKSVDELKRMIPKEILSRGLISTATDLENFFNLLNDENNRLSVVDKVDNQLARIKYAYLLIKDKDSNIIPTNTIDLNLLEDDLISENGKLVLPAGTRIEYNPNTGLGNVVSMYDDVDEDNYDYRMIYSMIINPYPLYTGFFMNIINEDPYTSFEWINHKTPVQFICESIHIERNFNGDPNIYNISLKTTQSINTDAGLIERNDSDNPDKITSINVRAYLVLYLNDSPYRYKELNFNMDEYELNDPEDYEYYWYTELYTTNVYDDNNQLFITDNPEPDDSAYIPEYLHQTYTAEVMGGYFPERVTAKIFILTRNYSKTETGDDGKPVAIEYGRGEVKYDLDNLIYDDPNEYVLEGWSLTNVYDVAGGLPLFIDYSSVSSVAIDVDTTVPDYDQYHVQGVPVIATSYTSQDENVFELVNQMNSKKTYIDNATEVLDNFEIDFKLFNTYGPSNTYFTDKDFTESIGRVDIEINFELELKSSADIYTKDAIEKYVKSYIENLNDLGDLHINNMLSEIREKYASNIIYFDFLGFNDFDGRTLHLYRKELTNDEKFTPPEFINIRTIIHDNGDTSNGINIETVSKTK